MKSSRLRESCFVDGEEVSDLSMCTVVVCVFFGILSYISLFNYTIYHPQDLADMIIQLDEYVEKGSELWLLNMVPVDERATLLKDKGNKEDLVLENLTIRVTQSSVETSITSRR